MPDPTRPLYESQSYCRLFFGFIKGQNGSIEEVGYKQLLLDNQISGLLNNREKWQEAANVTGI